MRKCPMLTSLKWIADSPPRCIACSATVVSVFVQCCICLIVIPCLQAEFDTDACVCRCSIANKISKKMAQLQKAELQAKVREDLKTVALGTSKINYMDPRITIAWCKRNEVPIEKVFNKSLLNKFHWCMDVESIFRF